MYLIGNSMEKEKIRERNRQYYQKNKFSNVWNYKRRSDEERRAIFRRLSLKRKYGLSLDEYKRMYESQAGSCAICRVRPTKKHLSVDHCHKTGKVRGLLCSSCNHAIGLFKEDIETIRNAIQYLLTVKTI